jgi:hypothetical protein
LKKFASYFFNHAFGVTGEKEAANPVTGVTANNNALPPIYFCIANNAGYFLVLALVKPCDSISTF